MIKQQKQTLWYVKNVNRNVNCNDCMKTDVIFRENGGAQLCTNPIDTIDPNYSVLSFDDEEAAYQWIEKNDKESFLVPFKISTTVIHEFTECKQRLTKEEQDINFKNSIMVPFENFYSGVHDVYGISQYRDITKGTYTVPKYQTAFEHYYELVKNLPS